MADKLYVTLDKLNKKALDDVGFPFSWLNHNISFVENNVKALKEKVDSPLAYALLINFLLLKNDPYQASHHIYIFKMKYPNHAFTYTLSALYLIKTNQFELAYKELTQVLSQYNSYYIWLLVLDCCVNLKWFDIGIQLSQKVRKIAQWNTNILIKFLEFEAYFQHHNFEFEKSIELRRKEIDLIINTKDIIKNDTSTKKFDISLAWKSLVDILNLLETNDIKAFPTAGTLLGWQRENAILSFDKDVDIAIMPDSDITMVKMILEKNPRYIFANSLPAFTSYLCIVDQVTGCCIDILKFYKNRGFYEYGWFLPKPYKHESRILRFTPFKLIKEKWNEIEMYIPSNAALFLSELYGNWQIPDSNYFGVISHNLTKKTNLIESSSYNYIVSNLRKRNYKKVKIIIEKLQSLGNTDKKLTLLKKRLTVLEK